MVTVSVTRRTLRCRVKGGGVWCENVITVKNLKTYFYSNNRCNKAVNGVSFDIRKGRTLCVVGESGCGKSVTASSIIQLLPKLSRIEEGEITYHSEEKGDIVLSKLKRNSKEMRSFRGSDIAMIFQDPLTGRSGIQGWLARSRRISSSMRM